MKLHIYTPIILIILSGCTVTKYKLANSNDGKDFLIEQINLMHKKRQTSKHPILVIDGVEYVNQRDINLTKLGLKKEDIKEIELLKQEAAVRIFGETGKRGVLLITTKTG